MNRSPNGMGGVKTASKPSKPRKLPGFERITHFWDGRNSAYIARILPGEYYVTNSDDLISTTLGSCISACIRDPDAKIGGMNHFMLPSAEGDGTRWGGELSAAARFGTFAMEHLINDLLKFGARRERLEVKVFGGGKVLTAMTDVGKRNINFIRDFLHTERYRIAAEDLGDVYPRKVLYYPISGRVRIKKLTSSQQVLKQETNYMKEIDRQPVEGDIDLF